ncbi:MAG: hypothetical protein IKZ34_03160 [Alphaproteobacteria bacterium]|nr:hypothetical protein [Alphaproteobacteria bacterium]
MKDKYAPEKKYKQESLGEKFRGIAIDLFAVSFFAGLMFCVAYVKKEQKQIEQAEINAAREQVKQNTSIVNYMDTINQKSR